MYVYADTAWSSQKQRKRKCNLTIMGIEPPTITQKKHLFYTAQHSIQSFLNLLNIRYTV